MRFEDFQYDHIGGHLRYRTRTILAILNPNVALMSPIKFGLNPLYGFGRRCPLKNFKMAVILDIRMEHF